VISILILPPPHQKILSDERIDFLDRHYRWLIARSRLKTLLVLLMDLCWGAWVLSLLDATLIQAHGDTFTITGFERVQQGMLEIDFAQTWLIDPFELVD
jgi:hypothetical protein